MVAGQRCARGSRVAREQPPAYTTNVATGARRLHDRQFHAFSGRAGQIGAITNCVQTEIFQVGNFASCRGQRDRHARQAVAPGNTAGTLSNNIDFTIGSQVVPADTIVFYIGVGADGDGALFRWESNGGVIGDANYSVNEELVPDVESMQILYGVETALSADTQTVAQYVTADNVANTSITGDFNGVISVQDRAAGGEPARRRAAGRGGGRIAARAARDGLGAGGAGQAHAQGVRADDVPPQHESLSEPMSIARDISQPVKAGPSGTREQRGVVLFTSLVLLVILTLVGVTLSRLQTVEERIAQNDQDHQLAVQAAEATLRFAEVGLYNGTYPNFADNTGGLYHLAERHPDAYPDQQTVPASQLSGRAVPDLRDALCRSPRIPNF